MSAEAEAAQGEAQAAQVELEYHREGKRKFKAMDAKLVAPKFNTNLIAKAYVDNLSTGSVKSGGGRGPGDNICFRKRTVTVLLQILQMTSKNLKIDVLSP